MAAPSFLASFSALLSVLAAVILSLQASQAQVALPVLAPVSNYDDVDDTSAIGPGLDGETGYNVTLLTYNTTCEGSGPATRISGDGTFDGTGLFVGVGTFTSSGESESSFVLTNGTFVGDGICSGEGVFGTDDPSGNLTVVDGVGTVSGSGIFHFPQGLFNGTGDFSGNDIFFEGGSAVLVGDGVLQGSGNASGDAIQCTGSGYLEGAGAFTGTGTFIGSGYYYATFSSDSAEFTGTGLLVGTGNCDSGDAVSLGPGSAPSPDIVEVIADGDDVYKTVTAVQESAPAPAPLISTAIAGK